MQQKLNISNSSLVEIIQYSRTSTRSTIQYSQTSIRLTAFTAYATNNMVHQHHLVREHEQPPLQPVAPSSCSFCSITINPINNRIPDRIKQHKYSPGSLVMVRLNNLSLKHKSHQVNIVELLGIFPASQIKVQTQSLIS